MRIFLAIDFPVEIKDDLIAKVSFLKQKLPELKWAKKPSLHLTLKFLGDVTSSKINEINNSLKNSFKDIKPFTLVTTENGLFPNPRGARVFYLGLQKSSVLVNCYNIIEEKLAALGFAKESRKFSPHITLARIKKRLLPEEKSLLLTQSFSEIKILASEIVLMQSNLSPAGARYTAVQRFSLRSI